MTSPRRRDLLEAIAANVRSHRHDRGDTQAGLAERADLDLRYLQKIEAGELDFGVTVLIVLADALEVEPSSLLRPAKLSAPSRGRPPKRDQAKSKPE